MPCFNSEKTIEKSVCSIINQDYNEWELIIIDDFSKDNSIKIIKKLANNDSRIKLLLNKKNLGVSATRNIGIEYSSGDVIAFCDSDDIWLPKKLSLQLEILKKGFNVVCSNYYIQNSRNNTLKLIKTPKIINYEDLLNSNSIPNSSALYNSKVVGKYFQKNIGHEDYLMWLKILNKNGPAYSIQKPLMKYLSHSTSISSNKFKSSLWTWNIFRNELKLGYFESIKRFCNYMYFGLKKHV